MANSFLIINITTVLVLVLAPPSTAEEDYYAVVVNTNRSSSPRVRGRFLAPSDDEPDLVRNNVGCLPGNNVCDGVWSQPGNGFILAHIYCCNNHCRNVLTDKNNCGECECTCPFGQACCNGNCTNIAYDPMHCGSCNNPCNPGLRCEYGSCGYA